MVYGQVKLAFASPNGTEKVVELMGPGQSFGEAVMFTERPYPVYSQALADSMLLHCEPRPLFKILANSGFHHRCRFVPEGYFEVTIWHAADTLAASADFE